MCGREGRKEREWKAGKAGLVAFPSVQLTQQSQGRWRHAHVHKHRQTDVHTEAAWGTGSASAVGRGAGCCPSTLCGSPHAWRLAQGPAA